MSELKVGQIWQISFRNQDPIFARCTEELDDSFSFVGVSKPTNSEVWELDTSVYSVINIYKESLWHFFGRAKLEEDVKLAENA